MNDGFLVLSVYIYTSAGHLIPTITPGRWLLVFIPILQADTLRIKEVRTFIPNHAGRAGIGNSRIATFICNASPYPGIFLGKLSRTDGAGSLRRLPPLPSKKEVDAIITYQKGC